MKLKVTVRGVDYLRLADPFDCSSCAYKTGCDSWGCVSAACSLTGECFECRIDGATICPFDDVHNEDSKRRKHE